MGVTSVSTRLLLLLLLTGGSRWLAAVSGCLLWLLVVAGFGDGRGQFLYDVDFDQRRQIGHPAFRDEAGFKLCLVVVMEPQGVGEKGLAGEVAGGDVEAGRLVVAQAKAHDDGPGAKAVALDQELHGRLRVRVPEAIVAAFGSSIPVRTERLRVGFVGWLLFTCNFVSATKNTKQKKKAKKKR